MLKPPSLLFALALAPFLSLSAQGEFLPVCARTPAVKGEGISKFQADDFTGLANLEILNIRSNPYTELPEGLLKDLVRLKTIVIIATKLSRFPDTGAVQLSFN
jgi:hypothetical protein